MKKLAVSQDRGLYYGAGIADVLIICLCLLEARSNYSPIYVVAILVAPFIVIVGVAIAVDWHGGTRSIVAILRKKSPRTSFSTMPLIVWRIIIAPAIVGFGFYFLLSGIERLLL